MKWTQIGMELACAIVSGCHQGARDGEDSVVEPWRLLVQRLDEGGYTAYNSRPHIIGIQEVDALFKIKEAYPWLIEAMEHPDPVVAQAVTQYFQTSSVPGAIARESLLQWYGKVPMSEWVRGGVLWEP